MDKKKNFLNWNYNYAMAIALWAACMLVIICLTIVKFSKSNNEPSVETTTISPTIIIDEPNDPIEELMFELNREDIEILARLVWGEARGCSKTEQAAVIWCVLNRMDSDNPWFPYNIHDVVTQPNQFYYSESFPLEDELVELAEDVMIRWLTEKLTDKDVGRVLPMEYCWFGGDGKHNYFRDAYEFEDANIWDWSLESPYED